jgi:hypothetical protein
MIRTVEMTKSSDEFSKCFRIFQETMSISEWQIERVKYLFQRKKQNHLF